MSKRYLIDTCAAIWLTQKEPMSRTALSHMKEATEFLVSSVTAWEMAMLFSKARIAAPHGVRQWFDTFLSDHHAIELNVTADLFISSCALPKPVHKDPIDRILIASARDHDLTIITRDRAILAYGAAGHVKTLAC